MWLDIPTKSSHSRRKTPAEPMTTTSTKAGACTCAPTSDSTIAGPQNCNSRFHQGDGSFCNPHYGRTRVANPQSFLGLLKLFEHEHEAQLNGSSMSGVATVPVSGGLQQMINRYVNAAEEYRQPLKEQYVSKIQFVNLPDSLQLEIFSYLGARTLCFVARVCQHWCMLTADDILWQRLQQRDVNSWHMISHMTNPDMYKECQSDWSFKDIYLRCSPEVNAAIREENINFHQLSKMLRSLIPRKTQKLVMFGPGLESGTSGIARKILEDSTGLFKTVGMFPGKFEGVGSGFTLKMLDSLIFHLVTLYTTTKKDRENFARNERLQHSRLMTRRSVPLVADNDCDSSMQYELQSGVKDLCRTVDAFVFVYDANLDNESENVTSSTELHALVNDRWTGPNAPVVVLACVPNSNSKRVSCIDVARHLDMGKFNRPWQVHDCVVEDMAGVTQALNWLVEQARRN